MKTVYLDRAKAFNNKYVVDYKELMNKHAVVSKSITVFQDSIHQEYKLMVGAPRVICVEGTYILLNSLVDLSKLKDRRIVNDFIQSVYHPELGGLKERIDFKWKRG